MGTLEQIVKEAAALGAAQVIETLGIHSGEISQNKARSRYGKWFDDAVKRGRLRPCRVDDGIRGTKHFRVVDIQELKTKDLVRAELHSRQTINPIAI